MDINNCTKNDFFSNSIRSVGVSGKFMEKVCKIVFRIENFLDKNEILDELVNIDTE